MTASVLQLADSWSPHDLHGPDRVWPESNCHVDLWIRLLHALGFEPTAALASALAMDLEGDQWTFIKIPPDDLEALYGIVIKELTIWRNLVDHIEEQVRLGRPVLVEVDAFALPDTAGVSYRTDHTKTTIAVEAIDVQRGHLRYFHNAGYHVLERRDFDQLLPREPEPARLPPYVEVVDLERRATRPTAELVGIARASLRRHVGRMPTRNPVTRYRARLAEDVDWLRGQDLTVFHRYAFANFRQCGAAAQFGAALLRWLEAQGGDAFETTAVQLDALAAGAKTLQFQVARVVGSQRRLDPASVLDTMEAAWASAATHLRTWREREARVTVGEV